MTFPFIDQALTVVYSLLMFRQKKARWLDFVYGREHTSDTDS